MWVFFLDILVQKLKNHECHETFGYYLMSYLVQSNAALSLKGYGLGSGTFVTSQT